VVFDATGNAASMMQAFHYVAPGGKLVFVGLFPGEVTFNDPEFHRRELTLLASRNATSQDFKNIIKWMEEGQINTEAWISHRCSFADLPATFEHWLQPESQVIKAIVALT
jgi:threonine dehydrogenase-like Zn-dependent dehydrogenase